MQELKPYHGSTWLCEPSRLQQLAHRVAIMRPCPTREQLVAARQEWRARAASVAADAIQAGGVDDPREVGATVTTGPKFLDRDGKEWQAEFRADAPTKAIRAVKGKIGIIPIYGAVDQRLTAELEKAGGTPLDFVSAAFTRLVNDPAIGAIVLHVDSPGGGVYGVEELSDKIYAARGQKIVYTHVDSMMASAALWVGTAASTVVATPGADVGSHGVYTLHVDQSGAMEQDGFKPTLISAGKYKTELNPFGPLSDDAKAYLQKSVDETYGRFTDALRRNRGVSTEKVRSDFGQGRMMSADEAMRAGLVDRVLTFEDLLLRLTGQKEGGGSSRAAAAQQAAVLRMQHAHRLRRQGKG